MGCVRVDSETRLQNGIGNVTGGMVGTGKKSRKPQQEEVHSTWEKEYVSDHLLRGHWKHCFAWLDNGVCPQYMVSGICCYVHAYPSTWTEEMIRKHEVIKSYMNELYRGCDILELVGRGKKSTALAASREIASYFAEAIDARVNEVDDSMTNQQLDNQDT